MTRVLFVDDETRILDGLQRMLRPLRNRWEMSFAPGGPEAMQALEGAPFDVVVTDMRMPEVDGAAVLHRVRDISPQTVRIVLSGQTDMATAVRTIRIAHQFLTKPCDADALRRVVERSLALRSLLDDETLRQAVGGVDALPSVPAVYAALEAVLMRPDSTLAGISAVVERDSALCAKVLQIVNSSFFGLPRQATRIEHAVNYLGVNVLRAVVLSHEVARAAGTDAPVLGFSLQAHQMHALLTAQLARTIMRGEVRALADDAFMAGMLHDIGELILAVRTPDLWTQLQAEARTIGVSLAAAEHRRGGASHATVGAYLLGLWGLPFHIVEAVAHHHTPSQVEGGTLDVLTAVHVADGLLHELSEAETVDTLQASGRGAPYIDEAYLATIGRLDQLPEWRVMARELAGLAEAQS